MISLKWLIQPPEDRLKAARAELQKCEGRVESLRAIRNYLTLRRSA